MMEEILVRVNERDEKLGEGPRDLLHSGKGIMHRAYVVFLFKGNELLMQRRSLKKKLWPGFWDVSYTSHVYPGETYIQAAKRKSVQELGIEVSDLTESFSFVYWAPFNESSEREFCKLLIGRVEGEPRPNPEEVMELSYMEPSEAYRKMILDPSKFTPWFKIALRRYVAQSLSSTKT